MFIEEVNHCKDHSFRSDIHNLEQQDAAWLNYD